MVHELLVARLGILETEVRSGIGCCHACDVRKDLGVKTMTNLNYFQKLGSEKEHGPAGGFQHIETMRKMKELWNNVTKLYSTGQ